MIKNTLLFVLLIIVVSAGNVCAQGYIGGNISLNGGRNQDAGDQGSLQNSNMLRVAPDIGRMLSEKWVVGVRPTIGHSLNSDNSRKYRTLTLGVNPYARYRMLSFGSFGIWAELSPELGLYNVWHQEQADHWFLDTRSLDYEIRLLPVLTYRLNRHVSLETRLKIVSATLTGRHVIYPVTGKTFNSVSYGLNASMDDLVNTLGDISIGFLYYF